MDNFYETLIMHAIFGLYNKQKSRNTCNDSPTFSVPKYFSLELINLNDDSALMRILTEMPKYLRRRDHIFRFYAETHLLRIKDTQKRIIYVYQEVPSGIASNTRFVKLYLFRKIPSTTDEALHQG